SARTGERRDRARRNRWQWPDGVAHDSAQRSGGHPRHFPRAHHNRRHILRVRLPAFSFRSLCRERFALKTALYFAIAILYLVPIWSVAHLPTSDGPSHLYNSWILRELIAGNSGPISRFFEIDWRPHPNWIGHALLALLMTIAPPVIAEKIFFSAIILLFFASIWLYAGKSVYAFLAFPFAYHQFLQTGFYNFSVSISLYFLIVAMWWKRRESPNPKTIALIAVLLIVCYFSHPMSTVLAMGSIGLLWLLTLRGRHAAHLLAFVPVIPLLAWFAWQRRPEAALNATAF